MAAPASRVVTYRNEPTIAFMTQWNGGTLDVSIVRDTCVAWEMQITALLVFPESWHDISSGNPYKGRQSPLPVRQRAFLLFSASSLNMAMHTESRHDFSSGSMRLIPAGGAGSPASCQTLSLPLVTAACSLNTATHTHLPVDELTEFNPKVRCCEGAIEPAAILLTFLLIVAFWPRIQKVSAESRGPAWWSHHI